MFTPEKSPAVFAAEKELAIITSRKEDAIHQMEKLNAQVAHIDFTIASCDEVIQKANEKLKIAINAERVSNNLQQSVVAVASLRKAAMVSADLPRGCGKTSAVVNLIKEAYNAKPLDPLGYTKIVVVVRNNMLRREMFSRVWEAIPSFNASRRAVAIITEQEVHDHYSISMVGNKRLVVVLDDISGSSFGHTKLFNELVTSNSSIKIENLIYLGSK